MKNIAVHGAEQPVLEVRKNLKKIRYGNIQACNPLLADRKFLQEEKVINQSFLKDWGRKRRIKKIEPLKLFNYTIWLLIVSFHLCDSV